MIGGSPEVSIHLQHPKHGISWTTRQRSTRL